jgi:hypothetical protein
VRGQGSGVRRRGAEVGNPELGKRKEERGRGQRTRNQKMRRSEGMKLKVALLNTREKTSDKTR